MSLTAAKPLPLRIHGAVAVCLLAFALSLGLGMAVALAGLHRLTPHLNLLKAPFWFWYYRDDPAVRRWLTLGALAGLIVPTAIGFQIARSLRRPLHGAARWARQNEIRAAGLRSSKGLILGMQNGRIISFGGSEHVLVYAPTRAGKGVGVVIPNLLNWPDSVVVLDVKRENWAATAGFRAAHGQETLLFDPLDPEGKTARYNPLGHIDRTDPIVVLDELQKLAVLLFPLAPHSDPFWAEAARTGFIGVGALVAATLETPFSLGEIYRVLTAPGGRERLASKLKAAEQADALIAPGGIAALSDFCSASDNTFASIKQTITARTNLWLNPHVDAATECSDFDLTALRRRRISIYLAVSPDNLPRIAPLYSLLFQQIIDLNTRHLPGPADKVEVLILLDEFTRLGAANVLAQSFAYVAGYGLRLMPVIQSPAQLRALYGSDLTEDIITNCGVEVVFAPKALKVAQELSERLGAYTYAGRTFSRPSGLSSGRRSQTDSDQRRPLMLPQELIQLPSNALIVLRAGIAPIKGRKIVYYKERAFTARLRPPPKIPTRLNRPELLNSHRSSAFADARPEAEAPAAPEPDPLVAHLDEEEILAWANHYVDRVLGSKANESDGS